MKRQETPLNGKYVISLGFGEKTEDWVCNKRLDGFLAELKHGAPQLVSVLNRRRVKGAEAYLELIVDFPSLSHSWVGQIWTQTLGQATCGVTPFYDLAA